MEFARPYLLWGLVLVPAVAVWIAWGVRRRRAALAGFTGERLRDALAPGFSWRKHLLKGTLETLALALAITALAGPRFGSQLVKVDREGVDVVVALDTSLSMLAEDMKPNRLERAKQSIIDLIHGLEGDRIGIVVFAGTAYALCPLTVDYDAALMFVQTIDVDMVSEPGTRLDKAIETSASLFEKSKRHDRAIIVVTDGENQEGDPVAAARAAHDKGIRVFTIGIGDPKGELIPERGTNGAIVGYKKDSKGQTVLTRLDEATLQAVASAGGGTYLPATREGIELKVLYNEISGMQRKRIKGEFVERRKERFWVFLAGALALLVADAAVGTRARGVGRRRQTYLHTGVGMLALVTALCLAAAPAQAKHVNSSKVRSGNRYYRAGEYDKALALYREALGDTTRPAHHSEGVFYNEGNALYMQRRYDQALGQYQKSFSDDSTLAGDMLYNRGNALVSSGKLSAAVQSYVQALQYFPDDPDVRHNLELALRKLDEQKKQQRKQQQSGNNNQKNQNQQKQDQQQGQKQQGQNGQKQSQGDRSRQQQNQQSQSQGADSTRAQQQQGQQRHAGADSLRAAQPADSSGVVRLSKEDAMRILQALEEQEKRVQEERHRAAFKHLKHSGKDW